MSFKNHIRQKKYLNEYIPLQSSFVDNNGLSSLSPISKVLLTKAFDKVMVPYNLHFSLVMPYINDYSALLKITLNTRYNSPSTRLSNGLMLLEAFMTK